MRFTDELTISAPVDVVWELTADVEHWPSLTPTITSVELLDPEPLRVGSTVRIVQPRQRPAVWTVTRFEPQSAFAWERRSRGIGMVATHLLEPVEGGTRNTLVLDIDGPIGWMVGRLAGRALRTAIATENAGFRRRAEELAGLGYRSTRD